VISFSGLCDFVDRFVYSQKNLVKKTRSCAFVLQIAQVKKKGEKEKETNRENGPREINRSHLKDAAFDFKASGCPDAWKLKLSAFCNSASLYRTPGWLILAYTRHRNIDLLR
jgi:hypothetical protein